jgi:hypothetical protein
MCEDDAILEHTPEEVRRASKMQNVRQHFVNTALKHIGSRRCWYAYTMLASTNVHMYAREWAYSCAFTIALYFCCVWQSLVDKFHRTRSQVAD